MKWKNFQRYWPIVRGIHLSPVNSPHKGQWRGGALMSSLISTRINGSVNNGEAGDLRPHRAHYGVTIMFTKNLYNGCKGSLHSTATEKSSWWQPWYLLAMLKLVFNISSEYQSCAMRNFLFSVVFSYNNKIFLITYSCRYLPPCV